MSAHGSVRQRNSVSARTVARELARMERHREALLAAGDHVEARAQQANIDMVRGLAHRLIRGDAPNTIAPSGRRDPRAWSRANFGTWTALLPRVRGHLGALGFGLARRFFVGGKKT